MTIDHITHILGELDTADRPGAAEVLPVVYDELRALAEAYLRDERANHTLQATALVHEAFLHLSSGSTVRWESRGHFFRIVAKTMRRILVNHAHHKNALKRGGGRKRLSLTTALATTDAVGVLELDDALARLGQIGEQKARVVELRYFAGCTIEETAQALGVSTATVERDWRFSRAWLQSELSVE